MVEDKRNVGLRTVLKKQSFEDINFGKASGPVARSVSLENIQVVTMVAVIHFTFVLSAIGISFAERLTREKT